MTNDKKKKSRKKPITPRSKIISCLRQLWLRSRERAAALKRAEYKCEKCGVKQSKAKGKEVFLEVHHVNGINNWDKVIDEIYKEILISPEFLQPLCKTCHEKTERKKVKRNDKRTKRLY